MRRRPIPNNPRGSLIERLESRQLLALTPVGGEALVNTTTTSDQFGPSVAADASGNYVVVWASTSQDGSGYGVFARRFNAAGTAISSEFAINTITADNQSQPSVAMSPSGAFVVTWTSISTPTGPSSANADIYARRFNASGVALDATEFQVNTFTTGTQESPHVAIDGAANFVVVWDSDAEDGSSYGIYARRYSANGNALSGEIQVNQITQDLQADPTIAMDRAGNFVIGWNAGNSFTGQDGSFYGIFARRYSASGAPLADEFQVNTYASDYQTLPVAAMDTDGDFVIAWQSYGQDSDQGGIYARRYDSSGIAQGNEFQINSTSAANQITPAIDIDARGDFTIAWTSIGQDGSLGGVYTRSYDYLGNSMGAETLVNVTTANDQSRPAVALNANGDAVVVWQSNGQDGSGYGLYSRRYTAPDQLAPTISSATFNYLTSQSISLNFSENVSPTFSIADITLQSLTPTVTTIPSGALTAVYGAGNVATITFTGFTDGVLPDGNYRITVASSGISDPAGNTLDGDDNGLAGGSYSFDFFVLAGDANRDRHVDAKDLGLLAVNWQGTSKTFAQGDFNYDSKVDIKDLAIFAYHFQQYLAPAAPAAALASISPPAARRAPSRVATSVLT